MKVIKYTYVDVHYNKDEQKSADKVQKYLEKLGYKLEVRDIDEPWDFCDQYHRYGKILK